MNAVYGQHNNNVTFYLTISAIVLQIAMLLLYITTGVTEFEISLSPTIIIFSIMFILVGVAIEITRYLVHKDKAIMVIYLAKYMMYHMGLLACMFFIGDKVNYLASVLVSIDGTKLTGSFIFTTLLSFAAWVTALVAAISYKNTVKNVVKGISKNE